jgi:uncharacterized damage-inducible protein DinB
MSENHLSLEQLYRGWDEDQRLLVRALTPLSEEQLERRAASHLRSVRELTTHITETRAIWLGMVMGLEQERLQPFLKRSSRAPARTVTELVADLESTWQVIEDALRSWTLADLETVFEGTWDGEDYRLTRQWVLWHLVEHDLFHMGELFLTLGVARIETPDL